MPGKKLGRETRYTCYMLLDKMCLLKNHRHSTVNKLNKDVLWKSMLLDSICSVTFLFIIFHYCDIYADDCELHEWRDE